ncbi:MAG: hypothetical protein QW356_07805 [Candidatus Hadarchaeales archaeon]
MSERTRHYVTVPAIARFEFPRGGVIQVLVAGKKPYKRKVEVDNYYRIHLRAELLHMLGLAQYGKKKVLVVKKNTKKNVYLFSSE